MTGSRPNGSETLKRDDRVRSTVTDCAGSTALVIAFAGWLIFAAQHYTVFDDEAFSCRLYAMPLHEMLTELWRGADPDPPLFYLFQNVSVRVFGVTPLALRGFAILCAAGALMTIRAAAGAWFGPRAAFATMVVAALHPAHLFFGFAARWYSLFMLLSCALIWLAGIVYRRGSLCWRHAIAGGVLAGLGALTHFFGLVIGAALFGLLLWKVRRDRFALARLAVAALLAAGVFACWIGPFVSHLSTFRDSSPSGSVLSTLARTLIALTTGNLASVGAWWVWAPMAIVGVSCAALVLLRRHRVAPVALVAIVAIGIAVLSRTMLDKYVLTVSGLVCVLLGGLIVGDGDESRFVRRLRFVMVGALAVAWAGCGVNLVTERSWSSLRWLDPISATIAKAVADGASSEAPIIASHPSVRYYAALAMSSGRAAAWRTAYESQERDEAKSFVVTPSAAMQRFGVGISLSTIFTIETSGFASLPDWEVIRAFLQREYAADETQRFLEDTEAALKDRLDPTIRHAKWRVTLTTWRRR